MVKVLLIKVKSIVQGQNLSKFWIEKVKFCQKFEIQVKIGQSFGYKGQNFGSNSEFIKNWVLEGQLLSNV